MKKIVLIIFIIILATVFSVVYKNSHLHSNEKIPTPFPSKTVISATPITPTLATKHSGWKTFIDTARHVSFEYPDTLSTKYIHVQTWPPNITLSSASFSCQEQGQVAGKPQVIQKTIGGTTYCIEDVTQGAAGTIYSDYSYTFLKNSRLVQLQFAIAYPQCGNYSEPKDSECKIERETFNLDALIDQIAQTIKLE